MFPGVRPEPGCQQLIWRCPVPNPYETAARAAKVTKLVDALDAAMGRRTTKDDLIFLSLHRSVLDPIINSAGVNQPSQATVDALVARIDERDRKFEEVTK